MMIRIYNDKSNKQFIVTINDTESHICKVLWLDEDLYDAETDEDEFDFIYVEARMVKVSGSVCARNNNKKLQSPISIKELSQ